MIVTSKYTHEKFKLTNNKIVQSLPDGKPYRWVLRSRLRKIFKAKPIAHTLGTRLPVINRVVIMQYPRGYFSNYNGGQHQSDIQVFIVGNRRIDIGCKIFIGRNFQAIKKWALGVPRALR